MNMNNFNYALFEILKYKVDICELLEYGLPIYNIDTTDINSKYTSIKSTYEDGTYKDIVQSLFTDYENINKAIKDFIQYYNPNTITKLSKCKRLKNIITYNKAIVDCYETISSVYTSILNEKDIYSITSKRIINLEKIITKQKVEEIIFVKSFVKNEKISAIDN